MVNQQDAQPTEREQFVRIYLNDHLAGAVAGTRLAHRLAEAERDGPDGPALATVAAEIQHDRQSLVALLDALGVEQQRYKQALAWAAEQVSSLKLNGRLVRRSPLSTLAEVEGVLLGVRGKLAGWETMRMALGEAPGGVDLARLIERAEAQLRTLAELHARAAERALGRAAGAVA